MTSTPKPASDWQELLRIAQGGSLVVERVRIPEKEIAVEGAFTLPELARLSLDDQVFIVAFLRSHGSIKEMEQTFGVSYPTIKARLNRIFRPTGVCGHQPVPIPRGSAGAAQEWRDHRRRSDPRSGGNEMTPNLAVVRIETPDWRGVPIWLPLFLLWIPLVLLSPLIFLVAAGGCRLRAESTSGEAIATFWGISCSLPGTDVDVRANQQPCPGSHPVAARQLDCYRLHHEHCFQPQRRN